MKPRKQTLTLIIPMLFVFALVSPSVLAQAAESTATLDETLSFIKNSMEVWGEGKWGDDPAKEQFLLLGGCKVQIFFTQDSSRRGKPNSYTGEEFSLSDLDPLAVEIVDSGLRITTANNKKLIRETQRFGSDSSSGVDHMINVAPLLIFQDDKQTNAKRIKRALEHAIKLCGGKVDPF